MSESTADTSSFPLTQSTFDPRIAHPGLLVAYTRTKSILPSDRFSLDKLPFTLGRDCSSSDLVFTDATVSWRHCRIICENGRYSIEDLKSYNGTFLNGERVLCKKVLRDGSVLRLGHSVLVFHENILPMLVSREERFGIVGNFFTGALLNELEQKAYAKKPIVLVGPTGSGKELAAKAIYLFLKSGNSATHFVEHNSADFNSENEAISALFGVEGRAFTEVDRQQGIIELANNGVLFLDEFHRFTPRIQSSLLKGMESGVFRRAGGTKTYRSDFKLILATNMPPPDFGLICDLPGRAQIVHIPSLGERRADVPCIFNYILQESLGNRTAQLDATLNLMSSIHYEALCLADYTLENVRTLCKLADIIASDTKRNIGTRDAVNNAFYSFFGELFSRNFFQSHLSAKSQAPGAEREDVPPRTTHTMESHHGDFSRSSKYEKNRELIERVYREERGNIAAVERALKREYKLETTYRWLLYYIKDKWKLRSF